MDIFNHMNYAVFITNGKILHAEQTKVYICTDICRFVGESDDANQDRKKMERPNLSQKPYSAKF